MRRQFLDLTGWRCHGLEAFPVRLGKDHEGRDHHLGPPGHQGGKPKSKCSCGHNNRGPRLGDGDALWIYLVILYDFVVRVHEAFYTQLLHTLANFSYGRDRWVIEPKDPAALLASQERALEYNATCLMPWVRLELL